MSQEGEIVAKMNAETKEGDFEGLGLQFLNDFRDQKLKMNDDKKVRIDLSKIKRDDLMIFMFVRTFDLSASPPKEGEFDRAMFRLLNEETNQTIDYKLIKSIELPEGFEEDVAVEVEEGEEAQRKSASYFGGRIFKEGETWLYESYGHVFTSEQHPDLISSLSKLYKETRQEHQQQSEQIKVAKEALLAKQEEEEKRNAARAAAQNKKGKKGKKAEAKPEEVPEEEKKVEQKEEAKKELNLHLPKEFREAIEEKVPDNFIFGPVTFKNLDNELFDEEKAREAVLEALSKAKEMPKDLFIHGFRVLAKGRTLHRASTI